MEAHSNIDSFIGINGLIALVLSYIVVNGREQGFGMVSHRYCNATRSLTQPPNCMGIYS